MSFLFPKHETPGAAPPTPPFACPECGVREFLIRGGLYEFVQGAHGPEKREVGWYGLCANTECATKVTFDRAGFRKYDPAEMKPKRGDERDLPKKRDAWAGAAFSERG